MNKLRFYLLKNLKLYPILIFNIEMTALPWHGQFHQFIIQIHFFFGFSGRYERMKY